MARRMATVMARRTATVMARRTATAMVRPTAIRRAIGKATGKDRRICRRNLSL